MGLFDRLQHAWNAFFDREEKREIQTPTYINLGYGSSYRPDRPFTSVSNERSIVTAISNRIAIDVSSAKIVHAKLDDQGRFEKEINSNLNNCLTVEANKDQTAKAFVRDIVISMLDEGVIAVVPVDTTKDPYNTESYDINTLRTAKIIQWYPDYVQVEIYNDNKGQRETLTLPKSMVAIIENPLYSIMNTPNSIYQRLIRKLNIMDAIDEQNGSGKLDLIIQLPYVVKTQTRKQQAENRRNDIESQLAHSKYGIAYTDGTEKITQLNRSIENNVLPSVQYLTSMLYSQLGITEEVLNGTADEKTMLNYTNRIVVPIATEIVDSMNVKFLTKTARTQHQKIMYFSDPFKFIPLSNLAEIADKFTRNEILSSNEMRQIIGLKPVNDPKADELRNKNININEQQTFANTNESSNNGEDQNDGDNEFLQYVKRRYGGNQDV